MLRTLFLSFILTFQFSQSFAKDSSLELLKKSSKVDYTEGCGQCELSHEQTGTVYSPHNKKSVELTILSEERAMDVFNKLKSDEDIPFNFPYEGCFARAHKMALDMDDMGIVSGKAFVEGELLMKMNGQEFGWSYHVASLVLVKKGSKMVPTVIDPAIFDKPVPFEEWKAFLLKDPKSKKTSEYFTKRFNYDPETRHSDLKDYNEEELENMVAINRGNARLADMMDMAERQESKKGLKK